MNNIEDLIINKLDNLTKGEKKVASYIQNNQVQAALLSSTELANICGVSDTTVIRFAKALGFKGYMDFKKNLRCGINTTSPYSLLQEMEKEHKHYDFETEYIENAINGLKSFAMTFDFEKLDKAADLILKANTVYCIGFGTDSVMTKFLSIYFQKIGLKVVNITEGGVSLWDTLLSISSKDLIIMSSFPRYLKDEQRIGNLANKENIPLITITKSDAIDILWHSDINFPVVEEHKSFFNSMLIPSVICNLILLKLYDKDPQKISKNLQRYMDFSIPDWL